MTGWSKWLPFLILPFGVAFFEVWLNIGIFANDGIEYELRGQIRESSQAIQQLNNEVASLKKMDNLDLSDPNLGLVAPAYIQVKVLRQDGGEKQPGPAHLPEDYQLAQAGSSAKVGSNP
jgi:hypothetical protein